MEPEDSIADLFGMTSIPVVYISEVAHVIERLYLKKTEPDICAVKKNVGKSRSNLATKYHISLSEQERMGQAFAQDQ